MGCVHRCLLVVSLFFVFTLMGCDDNRHNLGVECEKNVLGKIKCKESESIASCIDEARNERFTSEELWGLASVFELSPECMSALDKVAIADVVVQGYFNGFIDVEISRYYEFMVDSLSSRYVDVRARAARSMSWFDSDDAVSELKELAYNDDSMYVFRSVISSYRVMCVKSAGLALEQIGSDARVPRNRREIALASVPHWRRIRVESGLCD